MAMGSQSQTRLSNTDSQKAYKKMLNTANY